MTKKDLESHLEDLLRESIPDIKINIYKMEDGMVGLDAISKSFTGSRCSPLEKIIKILYSKEPGIFVEFGLAILPTTPEIFYGKIRRGEDGI